MVKALSESGGTPEKQALDACVGRVTNEVAEAATYVALKHEGEEELTGTAYGPVFILTDGGPWDSGTKWHPFNDGREGGEWFSEDFAVALAAALDVPVTVV